MKPFTATATKDGSWWVAQCDQAPEAQREAISMVTGINEADVHVEVTPSQVP